MIKFSELMIHKYFSSTQLIGNLNNMEFWCSRIVCVQKNKSGHHVGGTCALHVGSMPVFWIIGLLIVMTYI